MALAKMSWDELNELVGYKVSEPYDEYFAPMVLTERQKQRRIELANRLEEVFQALLIELFYCEQYGVSVNPDIYNRAAEEYLAVIGSVTTTDEYLIEHATSVITDTIVVLRRHVSDPYYYSNDRAMAISENEANLVWGYSEYAEAIKNKNFKTWHTIMDGKERESHAEVNGLTIPIEDAFELRGGYLRFPMDTELGCSDDEVVSCRCSLSFS